MSTEAVEVVMWPAVRGRRHGGSVVRTLVLNLGVDYRASGGCRDVPPPGGEPGAHRHLDAVAMTTTAVQRRGREITRHGAAGRRGEGDSRVRRGVVDRGLHRDRRGVHRRQPGRRADVQLRRLVRAGSRRSPRALRQTSSLRPTRTTWTSSSTPRHAGPAGDLRHQRCCRSSSQPGNPLGITGVADLAEPGPHRRDCAARGAVRELRRQVFTNAGVTVTPGSRRGERQGVVTKVDRSERRTPESSTSPT